MNPDTIFVLGLFGAYVLVAVVAFVAGRASLRWELEAEQLREAGPWEPGPAQLRVLEGRE